MNASQPLILHLDMNSYFASAEQQANPFLRHKPIAVVGAKKRSIVLAASIEAKRMGVKTGMQIHEAQMRCPGILLIHADGEKYLTIHERFISILEDYTERIEVFSIDEAFMDLSQDAASWDEAKTIALDIKRRFREELGDYLTCSIGIAGNKLLAKLGSDLKKPDGLTIIRPEDLSELFHTMPVDTLCGIGPRLKVTLNRLGIQTVEELGAYPETLLRAKFGIMGHVLHEMGQGRGNTFVQPIFTPEAVKSVSHSHTLARNTTSISEIRETLLWLSEKVGRRLRRKKLEGNVITLTLRQDDFSHVNSSMKVQDFLSDGLDLFRVASQLLDRLPWTRPIRLIGIAVTGIREEVRQLSFFQDRERQRALLDAMDQVNDKFGDWAILRALMLPTVARRVTVGGFAPHERRFFNQPLKNKAS